MESKYCFASGSSGLIENLSIILPIFSVSGSSAIVAEAAPPTAYFPSLPYFLKRLALGPKPFPTFKNLAPVVIPFVIV